jgi:hypothetical protein
LSLRRHTRRANRHHPTKKQNKVRVLEYDAASEAVHSVAAYAHAEELWDVAVCPSAEGRLLTVHSKGERVWC